ncbi:TonB-dependent receptor [Parasphingopyxis marina]|uniref:TonB-dependent receptor n=1 Tax=Parasphingopyxis marina TaxID=2761622 RepID=A0A842HWM9_9SPHN|nr:TonB-dependent receptor [Parasphingopyxis marina]MBC2776689.1 TonB-dependent receptor [Parasphingopyxis marina]
MKKSILLAGAALYFAATPAGAQSIEDEAAPAAADNETFGDTVILVTATRRSEDVQSVPLSVSVLGGELVENAGVADIRDFEQLTPSLVATTGQSSSNATALGIRGIGTAGDNPGFEPAVGVFIDGVYRARAGVALSELPPIERVEVLRGPQGTLFGRNTSAGALSIATEMPEFELGGFVEGSYGNYDAYELRGMVTGPVSDAIALRLDGVYRQRDGYITDVNSGRDINTVDRYAVRGQGLFENERLTIRFIADYAETDEECCGAVNIARGPTAGIVDFVAGLAGNAGIPVADPEDRMMAVTPGRNYNEAVKDWGVSAEATYEFDTVTLTSITAFRDWRSLRNQDIDFSGMDRAYRDGYRTGLQDFTQEIRIQGTAFDDRLDWLVGGFYLNETLTLRDNVRLGAQANQYADGAFAFNPAAGFEFFDSFGPTVPEFGQVLLATNPQLAAAAAGNPALFALLNTPLPGNPEGSGQLADNYTVDTQAIALFTHNVIEIADGLSLTLGLRWNHEEKDIDANLVANTPACDFFFDPAATAYSSLIIANVPTAFLLACNPTVNPEFNGTYSGSTSDDEFTGTIRLAYEITPDALIYAGFDRGYKSGGYNLDRAGFDTVLLGGDGPQIEDLEFAAETVDAYEIGLKTNWGREFTFNIAAFYQDFSNYQQLVFSGTSFFVQNVEQTISKGFEMDAIVRPVRDLTFQFGYAYTDVSYDPSSNLAGTPLDGEQGLQLSNVPRHTLTGAATWTPPLTDRLNALLHVDTRFSSDEATSTGGRGIADNEGHAIVNARIGIASDDDRWRVALFVENLFDTYYNISSFAVPEQTGTVDGYPGLPRFYGVSARFGF